MMRADWHIFQVLTKRSARMATWVTRRFASLPPNIWLGVSVEENAYTGRIRQLQAVPSKVRFLSLEPLIGPVKLDSAVLKGVRWVIVGGESGPYARRMDPAWVRDIKSQCDRHGVAFFFKQWGAFNATGARVGKKAAGRLFAGRTWDAIPATA